MIQSELIKEGLIYYELHEGNNRVLKYEIIKDLELDGYVISQLHHDDGLSGHTVTIPKRAVHYQGYIKKIDVLNIIKSSIERQIDELATELQEIQNQIDELNN